MLRRSRSMGVLYQDYGVVRSFILKIPAMIHDRDFYMTENTFRFLQRLDELTQRQAEIVV